MHNNRRQFPIVLSSACDRTFATDAAKPIEKPFKGMKSICSPSHRYRPQFTAQTPPRHALGVLVSPPSENDFVHYILMYVFITFRLPLLYLGKKAAKDPWLFL